MIDVNASVTTNLNALIGRYWQIHPNIGMGGVAIIKSDFRTTLVNSAAGISGMFTRFLIKKVTYKFLINNNEPVPVVVALIPVPSIIALTLSTNHTVNLMNSRGAKLITLQKAGVVGCLKTFSITVDLAQLEGLTPLQYKAITSYWCTTSSVGGLAPNIYLQASAVNGTSTFTTALGLDLNLHATFQCEGFNGNLFNTA